MGTVSAQQPKTAQPRTTQPRTDVNLPSFELRRGNRPITVQQTASDAEGGISIVQGGNCRKGQTLSFYYAPDPKRIETTVNNTYIRSSIVLRTQPEEGGKEAQDRAVLDFFGGSLELNEETYCPRNIKRGKQEHVVIREGRTAIEGVSLRYQNATGKGTLKGPVTLKRRKAGDSPALQAEAKGMEFDVDNDITTLRGNVHIKSGGRTSEAEVLNLDEDTGFAILHGNPARSRNDEGEVSGRVIEYDLDTNDVVVRQGIQATFNLDLGNGETSTSPPGSGDPSDDSVSFGE